MPVHTNWSLTSGAVDVERPALVPHKVRVLAPVYTSDCSAEISVSQFRMHRFQQRAIHLMYTLVYIRMHSENYERYNVRAARMCSENNECYNVGAARMRSEN